MADDYTGRHSAPDQEGDAPPPAPRKRPPRASSAGGTPPKRTPHPKAPGKPATPARRRGPQHQAIVASSKKTKPAASSAPPDDDDDDQGDDDEPLKISLVSPAKTDREKKREERREKSETLTYKRLRRQARIERGPARTILIGEFLICMILVGLTPVMETRRDDSPTKVVKRISAVMALFLILALISTAGRKAGKVAAGFGGLVTVTLAVSSSSLFVKLANVFDQSKSSPTAELSGTGDDDGGDLSSAIQADIAAGTVGMVAGQAIADMFGGN